MLDRLDSVPWDELTHAYGPASDVPGLIRLLRDPDPESRKEALWHLYGNIFHQGTRYRATPHAVPFLYELIDDPSTPDRERIIELLTSIALGYEEAHLPDGVDPAALIREFEEAEARSSPSDRERHEKYGFGPRVYLDCYLAVQAGVSSLIRLVDDGEDRVRRAAAYALAWFPSVADASLPRVRRLLEAETEEAGIANALLALGLLARGARDEATLADLRAWLSHPSFLVRSASAIAAATDPLDDAMLHALIDAVRSSEHFQGLEDEIRFNGGNLSGYAGLVLARGGPAARAEAVPALCEALKGVTPYQSLDITRALLDLALTSRPTPIKDTPAHSLDPIERAALRAIAEHGGWGIDCHFANYSLLVRAYGLPDSRERLRAYLDTPSNANGRTAEGPN